MPAIISVDRFVSVKYYKKFYYRNEFQFQFWIIIALLLFALITSSPFYYYDRVYSVNNQTQCGFNEYLWIEIAIEIQLVVFWTLVPFLISLMFSCFTAYQLIKNKKILHLKNFKKEKRLLKTLISMDVFYFMCNLPWCVYTIVNEIFTVEEDYHPYLMAILFDISNFLFYAYQSFSFFVFYFSNKQFKNYFKNLINIIKV